MIKIIFSDTGKLVYDSLDKIQEWDFNHSKYTIEHKPTGLKLWVAGGWAFFDNYKTTQPVFKFHERLLIWNKYQKARNSFLNQKLRGYSGYSRIKAIC